MSTDPICTTCDGRGSLQVTPDSSKGCPDCNGPAITEVEICLSCGTMFNEPGNCEC